MPWGLSLALMVACSNSVRVDFSLAEDTQQDLEATQQAGMHEGIGL